MRFQLLSITFMLAVCCVLSVPVQSRTLVLPPRAEIQQFQKLTRAEKTVIRNRTDAARTAKSAERPSKPKVKRIKGGQR